MYIQPNSTIILLKGVPLDNTYTDTIWFADASTQAVHFSSSYTAKRFDLNTYQRLNREYIRLQVTADEIYDYNYLMFRNTAYGNKWFYAFITSIEYINDNTSEIRYEIDVMQTWFFDYNIEPSFVEREHSATDNIGDNIIPEPIAIGDIKTHRIESTDLFNLYSVVVGRAVESSDSGNGGT